MTTRKKTFITSIVVSAIIWAIILAAWFRKADEAGVSSSTSESAFYGLLILGVSIVAGIVIFVSVVSGKKPPLPTWASQDRQDFPGARVVDRK